MPHPLASVKNPTPYWHKHDKLDLSDLEWNIPEQPSGSLTIIGGSATNFALPIRLGEYLSAHYPLRDLQLLLPDAIASKLPRDPRFVFTPSTPSGSIAPSPLIADTLATSDAAFILGDLTRNPVTAQAIVEAVRGNVDTSATHPQDTAKTTPQNSASHLNTVKPVLLTRDAVDLLAADLIDHPRLILIATLAQLQKLFRALYYPKVLLLSMPILPIVEALHKFTLSYDTEILTLVEGQIVLARSGQVHSIPLKATPYTPLTLWQGELAANYLALTLYNPSGLFVSTK